ncbi:MAG: D-alanyl-D-alanine carboxypeptidase family protein [Alphaproteobacteria bacterium]|jgi:D-alanyl-D-alanine carboxypeptidase (penicillin-binding protein 5/6)|nr:D-alanyl-D-alanine carboxypeptidase family protein [Alphaproteobacteria bacterium]MDP6515754.1 D-alanyl-D-alanine carboxypeptidase family protein [Alphaproteobacteria bacterium]
MRTIPAAYRSFSVLTQRGIVLILAGIAAAVASGNAGAFETAAREAILVDFSTGTVLLEKNADRPVPPASMSKLMTTYMVFERLKQGTIKLDDTMLISEKAWRMGGSKMFVEVGKQATVEDLLRGIIVQSGNDACIVVAEALAGSEEAFAEMMTARATEIGLTNSAFANATGWPADGHYMSARDLALLTRRTIVEFPDYFPYFAEKSFTYNDIRQGNRNPLLYKELGADGMKTGHTKAAGYGLTATALRNGRRLILMIGGLESARQRAAEATRLLNHGFREFDNYTLFTTGEVVETADVWLGERARVPLVINRNVIVTLARANRGDLQVKAVMDSPIPAPIAAGAPLGRLEINAPDMATITMPLVAGQAVGSLGVFRRLAAAVSYLLFGPAAD